MTIPYYIVNAFSEVPFKGNPAAVCIINEELSSETMQLIAKEFNQPATAFVLPHNGKFRIRCFTSFVELPLCGHGTLAALNVIQQQELVNFSGPVILRAKCGELKASLLSDGLIELNFPAFDCTVCELPSALQDVFEKGYIQSYFTNGRYLIELENEAAVVNFIPDFSRLKNDSVIITAKADANEGYDFVSRYFAAPVGVLEDAVTGSAHSSLSPYWSDRLNKKTMLAYQASARGGFLQLRFDGPNVFIAGKALTIMNGTLNIN